MLTIVTNFKLEGNFRRSVLSVPIIILANYKGCTIQENCNNAGTKIKIIIYLFILAVAHLQVTKISIQ